MTERTLDREEALFGLFGIRDNELHRAFTLIHRLSLSMRVSVLP